MKNTHNVKSTRNGINGVRGPTIRKNSPGDLILRRLGEYSLFSKPRSILPPFQSIQTGFSSSGAQAQLVSEYVISPDESLGESRVEEDENVVSDNEGESIVESEKGKSEEEENYEVYIEDDEARVEAFVPSIKIKRMDTAVIISTLVVKDVALSSALFRLLEQEKLNIVYESQYRTQTKVSHTIQVKVQPEYDVDALEKKLLTWAVGGTSNNLF